MASLFSPENYTADFSTLALYGRPAVRLTRFGWGQVEVEALTRHRARSLMGSGHSDPPPRE